MHHAPTHAAYCSVVSGAMLALCLLLTPAGGMAADAHQAVQAKPGEIVLLRNVAARPAVGPAPPGMALIVDPSPRLELATALGTDELSDADCASLDAVAAGGHNEHRTTIERVAGQALGGSLGSAGSSHASVSGNGISNVVTGPIGSLGNATHGIGNQVQGAFSQLPGLIPPTTGGH